MELGSRNFVDYNLEILHFRTFTVIEKQKELNYFNPVGGLDYVIR